MHKTEEKNYCHTDKLDGTSNPLSELEKAQLINDNFGKMTPLLTEERASKKSEVHLYCCLLHTFVNKFFSDFPWRPNKVYMNFALTSMLKKTVAKKISTFPV